MNDWEPHRPGLWRGWYRSLAGCSYTSFIIHRTETSVKDRIHRFRYINNSREWINERLDGYQWESLYRFMKWYQPGVFTDDKEERLIGCCTGVHTATLVRRHDSDVVVTKLVEPQVDRSASCSPTFHWPLRSIIRTHWLGSIYSLIKIIRFLINISRLFVLIDLILLLNLYFVRLGWLGSKLDVDWLDSTHPDVLYRSSIRYDGMLEWEMKNMHSNDKLWSKTRQDTIHFPQYTHPIILWYRLRFN